MFQLTVCLFGRLQTQSPSREIKIDKDITTERIDPIDAIIDAWKHAMKEEYRPDVNETVNEWLEQFEKYMKKGGEK